MELNGNVIQGFAGTAGEIVRSAKPTLVLYNGADFETLLALLKHFQVPYHMGIGEIKEAEGGCALLVGTSDEKWSFSGNQQFVISAMELTNRVMVFSLSPALFQDKVLGQELGRLVRMGAEFSAATPGTRAEPQAEYRLVHVWFGADGRKHVRQAFNPDGTPIHYGSSVPMFQAYALCSLATLYVDKRIKVRKAGLAGLFGATQAVQTAFQVEKSFV